LEARSFILDSTFAREIGSGLSSPYAIWFRMMNSNGWTIWHKFVTHQVGFRSPSFDSYLKACSPDEPVRTPRSIPKASIWLIHAVRHLQSVGFSIFPVQRKVGSNRWPGRKSKWWI